jgi:2-haloacid dehalogenase
VSYDALYDAIEARIGDRLKAQNIGSRLFGYAWIEAGEKEYTYLSLSEKYVKFFDVFRSIFYRTLWQAGVQNPRQFATDEDREHLLASYRTLKTREGLLECFTRLREAGFTVWAFTSGDTQRVAGYLSEGGASLPPEHFVSCDTIGVGKPAPACYQHILEKFPKENLEAWFAAAHMWDAAGARHCG